MSEQERKESIEKFNQKIPQIPEEQRQYLLGYMEGICQMSEKSKKKPRNRKPKK